MVEPLKPSANGKGSGCQEPNCPLRESCLPDEDCTLCTTRDVHHSCEEMLTEMSKPDPLRDSQLIRMDELVRTYKKVS